MFPFWIDFSMVPLWQAVAFLMAGAVCWITAMTGRPSGA